MAGAGAAELGSPLDWREKLQIGSKLSLELGSELSQPKKSAYQVVKLLHLKGAAGCAPDEAHQFSCRQVRACAALVLAGHQQRVSRMHQA